MATDPPTSSSAEQSTAPAPPGADSPSAHGAPALTRAGAAWVATAAALLLLVLLIVFMLQNSTRVAVHFLSLSSSIPLGMALLIAAVGGGVVVAVAGVARVTQLRLNARRARRGEIGA
ncbi:MAG TPA: lipopolysaccharide assembly protein LapA domain-containing protein [Pedococcus sp.]|nr:lipopolysaccharide assembly protein LapA domain-containing protein [Pedococcus sp.]